MDDCQGTDGWLREEEILYLRTLINSFKGRLTKGQTLC